MKGCNTNRLDEHNIIYDALKIMPGNAFKVVGLKRINLLSFKSVIKAMDDLKKDPSIKDLTHPFEAPFDYVKIEITYVGEGYKSNFKNNNEIKKNPRLVVGNQYNIELSELFFLMYSKLAWCENMELRSSFHIEKRKEERPFFLRKDELKVNMLKSLLICGNEYSAIIKYFENEGNMQDLDMAPAAMASAVIAAKETGNCGDSVKEKEKKFNPLTFFKMDYTAINVPFICDVMTSLSYSDLSFKYDFPVLVPTENEEIDDWMYKFCTATRGIPKNIVANRVDLLCNIALLSDTPDLQVWYVPHLIAGAIKKPYIAECV